MTRLARFGDKRHGANGYDAYQGRDQAWCYICDTAHPWRKPCPAVDSARTAGKYAVQR